MQRLALPLLIAAAGALSAATPPSALAPAAAPATAVHCQVPCGIYGDQMRIDMLMEDAATIDKAMTTLRAMDAEEHPSQNQMVRWVVNKEKHAQAIQDTVAAYWLAQRIKAPKAEGDAAAMATYHGQLAHMHRLTVAAMKCKQTTDAAHVQDLRATALAFSATYFSGEDLEHIRSHHGEKHR
jgi:hypothetical protein